MIINWMATKAQQFLAAHDSGLDELNLSFDFALSPEIINLLYAKNDDMNPWLGEAVEALSDEGQQASPAMQFALDEYEQALA